MRPSRPLLGPAALAVLSLLFSACGGPQSSAASCVGPYLDNQPPSSNYGGRAPTVSPGAALSIHGHWYTSTCNDTGGHDPLVALAPVHLTLVLPNGEAEPLGVFTPGGQDMGFSTTLHIPPATTSGTAEVRDGIGHTYQFQIQG